MVSKLLMKVALFLVNVGDWLASVAMKLHCYGY